MNQIIEISRNCNGEKITFTDEITLLESSETEADVQHGS